jgi:hypothetical protein
MIWTQNSLQKFMRFFIIENMNQNYSRIPCFVEMKLKQQIKFVVYQNKIYGFSTTKYLQLLSLFPKLCV